ncbi:MAG: 3-keto-5-aminohexanoate cleavage protein [Rhizobiaceae bacterium]
MATTTGNRRDMETTGRNRSVAIAVAPNGGRRTKADHPALPLTHAELASTAAECLDAGAAMIHVHVRKPDGSHLLDAEAYRVATAAIREAVGDRLVVQITSEALGLYQPEEQMRVVRETRPEAVSLALREYLGDGGGEEVFADFLAWLSREKVMPQIILYDTADAARLEALRHKGALPWENVPVLYVLGRYTKTQQSAPADLLPFLAPDQPRFGPWMVCAFGRDETACVSTAALLGGHARVGFENNLFLPDGSTAASNAELVKAVTAVLDAAGRTAMTAGEMRDAWTA